MSPGDTEHGAGPDQPTLPIYAHADELLQTIRDHRVVIVEGPTGSGKTTQLPRMLLREGIGSPSLIGVTQPRRIAAVSVAWRIAHEERVTLGEEVGYAIRFDDRTSARTQLKVMTDEQVQRLASVGFTSTTDVPPLAEYAAMGHEAAVAAAVAAAEGDHLPEMGQPESQQV